MLALTLTLGSLYDKSQNNLAEYGYYREITFGYFWDCINFINNLYKLSCFNFQNRKSDV